VSAIQKFSKIIELTNLSYQYPGAAQKSLSCVNLNVFEGSIWGLLGPNGAGKTTLIRLLTGLLLPNEGIVKIFGKPLNRQVLQKIGVLIENCGIYKKMRAREYLGFFGGLFEIPRVTPRINELADIFGLNLDVQPLGKMSLGQRQIIQIMRSLLAQPQLVIWDEPLSNLDPQAQKKVKEVMREYVQSYKTTFLIATHQLNQADLVCDNIMFVNKGKTLFCGSKEHLYHCEGVLQSVLIEVEAFAGGIPIANWRALFDLQFELVGVPLNSEEGTLTKPLCIKISGAGLEDKIPNVVNQFMQDGLGIKSVVPEKKDMYDIYANLMENIS